MSTQTTVAMPVDIHRPDRVLFGLTAAQAAGFAVTGLGLWLGWAAVRTVVGVRGSGPAVIAYLVFTALVLLAVTAVALGRRDGVPLAVWLRAAAAYRAAPRRLAPEVTGEQAGPPSWLRGSGPRGWARLPGPWRAPARGVNTEGLIDLGPDGTTALVAADTVTFGLCDPDRQAALIAGFTGWLHGIGPRTQILVRAHPVTLAPIAARATGDATRLPTPALAAAAREHAGFLARLDTGFDLLARRVVIAVRDPSVSGAGRRGGQAAADLAAAGIHAAPLPAADVLGLLGACLHADHPRPAPPPDRDREPGPAGETGRRPGGDTWRG